MIKLFICQQFLTNQNIVTKLSDPFFAPQFVYYNEIDSTQLFFGDLNDETITCRRVSLHCSRRCVRFDLFVYVGPMCIPLSNVCWYESIRATPSRQSPGSGYCVTKNMFIMWQQLQLDAGNLISRLRGPIHRNLKVCGSIHSALLFHFVIYIMLISKKKKAITIWGKWYNIQIEKRVT